MQTRRQNNALLLGQILNRIKPRIQYLILDCRTIKEMWIYLNKLNLEGNNLSRVYDVLQELFGSKQKSRTLPQFYVDFNKFSDVKEIFSYRNWCEGDAWEMEQIDDPCILRRSFRRLDRMWLAALPSSHLRIFTTLREDVPPESQNSTIMKTQNRSALAI